MYFTHVHVVNKMLQDTSYSTANSKGSFYTYSFLARDGQSFHLLTYTQMPGTARTEPG